MNVLALTHAHLNSNGLSPVSCERADSITGSWVDKLNWHVDVIHTKDTKWPGIWPGGKGLKINTITIDAPKPLMLSNDAQLFSSELKALVAEKKLFSALSLTSKRIRKRLHALLAKNGHVWPHELSVAGKWGEYLSNNNALNKKKYDFIFVCVGYGDEYLLRTGHTISKTLNIPMIVDFRDLWSDHHMPGRFTEQQISRIRKYEKRLLSTTSLISVPQKHMAVLLKKWTSTPVYYLSHSAYTDPSWKDGNVTKDEFTMLYAGKLYPEGPGIKMLLDMLAQLATATLLKPFKCHFFVDNTKELASFIKSYGLEKHTVVNDWISPAQLWGEMRSAHLLVITDSGVAENYPILPTKIFQYTHTGRQILCLSKYSNDEMQDFLTEHRAGISCIDINEAANWVTQLAKKEELYYSLPPLRNVPLRENMAVDFGKHIESLIKQA